MEEKAQFGIGFVSGRPNVCAVINNTYKHLLNQTKKFDREVELTIFILYDLSYQKESREEDFYKILPEVHKDIKIVHITPQLMFSFVLFLIHATGYSSSSQYKK